MAYVRTDLYAQLPDEEYQPFGDAVMRLLERAGHSVRQCLSDHPADSLLDHTW